MKRSEKLRFSYFLRYLDNNKIGINKLSLGDKTERILGIRTLLSKTETGQDPTPISGV
jgi:hypothetical protein